MQKRRNDGPHERGGDPIGHRRLTWLLLFAVGWAADVQAQQPAAALASAGTTTAVARCDCGRWTCPICQSRCGCPLGPPPCPPSAVEWPPTLTPSSPSITQPPAAAGAADLSPSAPNRPPAASTTAPFASPAVGPTAGAGGSGAAGLAGTLGVVAGTAGAPNMVGDFFGGGSSTMILSHTIPVSITAQGFVVQGIPGDASATIVFEAGADTSPNDFFSVGSGTDATGDDNADTFAISEPIPPSDAPTSPGPGFVYAGGTAVNPSGTFQDGDTWLVDYGFANQLVVVLPNPSTGGAVVGRMKIAENTSPMPRNRVFLNYSYFDNVPLIGGGVDVHRLSPGFESTLFDESMSIELRTPMASTLDNQILADGATDLHSAEFGNLFLALKYLLARSNSSALSVGMSLSLPTADDLHVALTDGTPLVDVRNQSVHLMPFLGWLTTSSNGFFAQGFFQVDVDANGNAIEANRTGRGLEAMGTLQDPTLFYLDVGAGRKVALAGRRLTYVAPTLELHYNRSLQSADVLEADGFRIGEAKQHIQILNAVTAVTFGLGQHANLSVGYATPLGNGADQMFDGELRMFWNRNY